MTDSSVVPEYRHVPIGYLDQYSRLVRVDSKLSFLAHYPLRQSVAELESYVRRGRSISFRDEGYLEIIRAQLLVDVSGLTQRFDHHSVLGVLQAIRAELIQRLNAPRGATLTTGLSTLAGRIELSAELSQLRSGQLVALVFMDLDHFKTLNDSAGHSAGDACLERIVDALISVATDRGAVYRYGGDEFVLLLRNATCLEAAATAERVRGKVETIELTHGTHVTTSIGVASTERTPVDALLNAADEAMYGAKAAGKNRVVSHPLSEEAHSRLLLFRSTTQDGR